ncbi:septation ring formation regulator EzrA [Lactococcus termiticola]|uniref:Septation ring formation regulator EzrA n=1 Tax=Lactococcus termiticola TaxID=2169526 RepID=A0A2R5HGX6_9LACT|nr:septation ring formation regulator EzrA [Lactococcus termiticola]GBG96605.1 septation ring formation regulator EzrA [Lactococcus termiticola]
MSSTIIIVLVVLVVIILAFYIFAMVMRKKTEDRILDLEERKESLFDLPVQEEMDAVKKMHLVGQSQTMFREWNQKWIDLSSNSFADLEEHIFEAEQLNDSFHFFKARESVNDSEAQIEIMEDEVKAIREGVAELTEQERRNSAKIDNSLDLYEELKAEVSDNSKVYGFTIDEIQKQLANIELEFSQFVTLNSTGDPIEAAEVLDAAEDHTLALRAVTERIPDYITLVEKDYPQQIADVKEAKEKFEDENYVLPESVNLDAELKDIEQLMSLSKASISSFELEDAEAKLDSVSVKIDNIYSTFEKEYASRRSVEKRAKVLDDYIEHAKTNNKNLLLEIDHIMQAYILSGNEKGFVRGYQEHLETLEEDAAEVQKAIEEKAEPDSQLAKRVNAIVLALEEMEKNQLEISNKLVNLKDEEQAAQSIADKFENELHIIKRYVEKQNLPGLPKDYLELFFNTSDRVQNLFKELDKIRINIDTVNHLVDVSTEAMHTLKDATDELISHAVLAEQLMQYANRYKASNDKVAHGIGRAMQLFDGHNYNGAFDEISRALETAEAGAAERISGVYYNNQPKPDYR